MNAHQRRIKRREHLRVERKEKLKQEAKKNEPTRTKG